ncbi:MAG TPA: carboxypeptidase regulatory-like domain-containing protein, partial [Blastocatellia bacterium]|nr:carboxypeptidase regulatory-like domain-containing protein [Blastocatellia bacterium]
MLPPPTSARYSLTAPLTDWLSLASWHTGRLFRNLFRPQGSPNLNTLRSSLPNLPDPPNGTNVAPPSGYDDPKPANTSSFSSYYTEMNRSYNDTGTAGGRPLQLADPTAGSAAAGGLSVNPESKNFNFTAPVLSLSGRAGLNLMLALSYNDRVWTKSGSVLAFNADKGFPGPGWRVGFGAIQGIRQINNIVAYTSGYTGKQSFLYIAPDGTRHELAKNNATGLYESYDGSYLDFNLTTKVLRKTDGTQITFGVSSTASGDYQFLPTQIKDRNGNFITIAYKTLSNNDSVIDYLLDTLSRRIDFWYENNRLREIRQDRAGVLFKHAIIDYEPVTISTSLQSGVTTDPATISGQQVCLPTRITYPTGTHYRFYYTSYAQMWLVEKWAPSVQGQGAARRIAYTRFNLPSVSQASIPANSLASTLDTTGSLSDCPLFTVRADQAENWNFGNEVTTSYTYAVQASGQTSGLNLYHRVTGPLGEFRLCYELALTRVLWWVDPNNNSATVKQDWTVWTSDSGVSYTSNARVTESKTTDTANTRRSTFVYSQDNGVWLVTQKNEYQGDSSTVYRRTETAYTSYATQRIIGLPAQVSVYAGPGTTLMSRTSYAYDETTTFTDSNGQVAPYFIDETSASVVQHDNTSFNGSFTQRGNQTTVTQSGVNSSGQITGSRIIRRTAYDTNGNVRSVTDGAGNRRQTLYTDNFSTKPGPVGATQAYPYTSADPTGFRNGRQYDYWDGHPVKTFNLKPGSAIEEQVTTISYDFADRPLQTTRPDGGWTQNAYWDNALYQTTTQKIDTVSGQDQTAFSFKMTDGAGRVLRKGSDHPNAVAGKYAGQKFVYDEAGRQIDVSNVTAMDADWNAIDEDAGMGWLFRNFQYDVQGRPKKIINPDSTEINYDYTGCGCAGGSSVTQTDERGCLIKTESDFMGRLYKSSEMTDLSNAYNTAIYTYDALDRITRIDVKAGDNGPATQMRTFVYDDYGRLQSETTPEAGTVSYTYKPNDQVDTKTDARGKVVTYTYNTRTLLTGLSYNDGGATPSVNYGYDEYGARSSMTDGEGTTSYYYNSFRQLDHETRSFTGLPGKYYRLDYTYNLASQPKQVSYVATTTTGLNAAPDNGERIASTQPAMPATEGTGKEEDKRKLKSAFFPQSAISNLQSQISFAPVTPRGEVSLFSAKWNEARFALYYSAKDTLFGSALERLFGYGLNSQGGFTISGTVTRDQSYGGQAIGGVTVTAQRTAGSSGPAQVQVQTNSSGAYSISGLPLGTTYQISASKAGWNLSPVAQSYYMFTDVTQNFTGVPSSATTTISGTVSSAQGGVVSGVTMTLSGSMNQTTTTDASGNYSFTVSTLGNYTVTPSKSGWLFNNPSSASTTDDVVLPVTMSFSGTILTPPPAPPAGAQTWTKNVNYVYNSVGSLVSVGTNLTGTDPNATTNVVSGVSYTSFGSIKSASYGNGRRQTLGYSVNRHQLTSVVVDNQNGTDPIINRSYEYRTWNSELGQWNLDNDGRIKKITDNLDTNYTTAYSYDQFNRLTKANATGYYRQYDYDAWGNLTMEYTSIINGITGTAYEFAANASGAPATNRLNGATNIINSISSGTTSFAYDAAGNLTQDGAIAYSYDAASRLKEVGTGGQNTYRYDGDGNRVKVVANGGAPIYYVKSSVLGQVAMEIEGSQAVLNRAYVYASGKLVAEQTPDGQFYWTHNDHLGSTRRLTNTSGTVVYRGEFDPFGKTVLETGSVSLNSHKYTGYERDWATGLDYANARMYASLRGRFMQSDPVTQG